MRNLFESLALTINADCAPHAAHGLMESREIYFCAGCFVLFVVLQLFVGIKEVRVTVGDLCAVFANCVARTADYHVKHFMRCYMRCWSYMRY